MPGRRSVQALLLVITATVALVAGAAPASAAPLYEDGENVTFTNKNSGKCLEILNYSTAEMAPAGQFTCYSGPNQLWGYSTRTGLIVNKHSGKCLEVLNYSTAEMAPVGQFSCYGGENQRWYMDRLAGKIMNKYSNKCLEVLNYSTAEMAVVGQFTCYYGPNQTWFWYHP